MSVEDKKIIVYEVKNKENLDEKDFKAILFIVLSGVAGALSWLFYFVALKGGTANQVVATDRLSIVFVVVFALIFLGEKIDWKSWIGAGLILVGAILIAWK